MLDGFDGLVLVNALNVHGDDLAGIHVQKIFQQLVTQVGGGDGQETDRPEDAAHLEGAAVLKGQRRRCDGVLYGQAAFHEVFPVEVKLRGTIHVQHPVHEPQALLAVQRLCLHTEPVKVVHQVVLDVLQPGLDLRHAFALNAISQEFCFGEAVVAFGKLLPKHLAVLSAHIIETVLLVRNTDGFLEILRVGGRVHERQLKVDGAVKKVEERAPFFKDGSLVLLLSQLVIDVLISNRPGIIAGTDPAGSILEHPLHRDGLLRRVRNGRLGRLFAVLILFREQFHGLHLPS